MLYREILLQSKDIAFKMLLKPKMMQFQPKSRHQIKAHLPHSLWEAFNLKQINQLSAISPYQWSKNLKMISQPVSRFQPQISNKRCLYRSKIFLCLKSKPASLLQSRWNLMDYKLKLRIIHQKLFHFRHQDPLLIQDRSTVNFWRLSDIHQRRLPRLSKMDKHGLKFLKAQKLRKPLKRMNISRISKLQWLKESISLQ